MDMLPEILHYWLLNYGSFSLFFILALGIVALPIPEETLLVFSGILISKGIFYPIPTLISAFFGSVLGITLSYTIGSTGGVYLLHKYGPYVGLTSTKMEKVHSWFEHYGKWMLFIGYFIPGVRHFTGIVAGLSTLPYRDFALFAYTGAFFWVSLFLSVGYFFGGYQQQFFEFFEENVELTLTFLCLAVILAALLRAQYAKSRKK